jgi:hypothetical protein
MSFFIHYLKNIYKKQHDNNVQQRFQRAPMCCLNEKKNSLLGVESSCGSWEGYSVDDVV